MSFAHPVELRKRVVTAYEAGEGSYPMIAKRFGIGEASVKRWVWRYRETGTFASDVGSGGRRSEVSRTEIDAIMNRLGDANAGEITAEYNHGRRGRHRVHRSTIKRALHRYGYVVKKNGFGR